MYKFHTEFFKGSLFDSATVTMSRSGEVIDKRVFGYNETELIEEWIESRITDLELAASEYSVTDNRK